MWGGETCNTSYLTSHKLRETAKHLIEVADWLDREEALDSAEWGMK